MLLIDDNLDLVEALAWGLGLLGYDVRTAHDGVAGLELAIEFRPDAALIDISLPGIDGWMLAERMCSHPHVRRPRMIALTGRSAPRDRTKSAASGFDHHVVKPVSLARLDALLSPQVNLST